MSNDKSIVEEHVSSFEKFSERSDRSQNFIAAILSYHPKTFILNIDTFTRATTIPNIPQMQTSS